MSILKVNAIRHSSATVDAITTKTDGTCEANVTSINGGQISNKNKVDNGSMLISQRYGTSSHTPSNTSRNYVLDRYFYWSNQASKASVQQVTDAPVGFSHSAKCTVVSAHTASSGHWFGFGTTIEAQDMYDLEQGTSNAKTFTLSFYVKSSVTGTWHGASRTKAGSPSRSYPFSYTINSANTWERKTITIEGCPDGTWLTGINEGMCLWFDLGTGSDFHQTVNQWFDGNSTGSGASPFINNSGATWFITGIQLESGSIATEYEHCSYAKELDKSMRYYQASSDDLNAALNSNVSPSGYSNVNIFFKAQMRTTPTVNYTWTGNDGSGPSQQSTSSIGTNSFVPLCYASGNQAYRINTWNADAEF